MDIKKLIGDASAAMPEELSPIIDGIIHGDVISIALVAEHRDGSLGDLFFFDLNDGDTNVLAVIGCLETLKRDIMRCTVKSRLNYREETDD